MQAEPQVRVCAVLNDMYENLRSMRNIDLNDHEFCKQLANHGLRFVHSNRTLLRDCYADATNPISPKPRWPQDAAEYVIIELVAKPKTTAQKVTLYFICRLICTKLNDRLTEDNRFIVFKDFVKLIKARLSQIRGNMRSDYSRHIAQVGAPANREEMREEMLGDSIMAGEDTAMYQLGELLSQEDYESNIELVRQFMKARK